MKRITHKESFTNFSGFLLKVIFLVARIYTTLIGFTLIIGGTFGVWSGSLEYLGGVVLGIIFLWPLRKLKDFHLMNYFWILVINSFLFVIQGAIHGPTTPWYLGWIQNLFCWVNVIVVWQYTRYRLSTSTFNPLFEFKKLVVFLMGISLLGVLLFGYLFFDPRETKNGKSYFNFAGLIVADDKGRWAEPLYDKAVFDSEYSVNSSFVTPAELVALDIVVPISGEGKLELIENEKTILEIGYGKNGVGRVVAYDDKAPWGLVGPGSLQPWRRTKENIFIPESKMNMNMLVGDANLWVGLGYESQMYGEWVGGGTSEYHPGDAIQITLKKFVNYPEKRKLQIMPYARTKLPWNLAIKQGNKQVEVVQGIELWYR